MAMSRCVRCEKLFEKIRSPVCSHCESDEEDDYEKVRQALSDTPNQTAEQVAEETGVGIECVLRLLSEGRIASTAMNVNIKCGRCGAPAISASKKLCEACLEKLNAQLLSQQSKIKLPDKKDVALGTALNVFESRPQPGDKSGGTKYHR